MTNETTDETKTDRFPSPVGNMTPQTAMILGQLRKGKPGDRISDAEFHEMTGIADPDRLWARVRVAKRNCTRTYGIVWHRTIGEGGIRCLNDDEVVDESEAGQTQLRRKCRETAAMLAAVDTTALTDGRKEKHVALMRLTTLHHSLTNAVFRRMLIQQGAPSAPDRDRLLGLFRANGNS